MPQSREEKTNDQVLVAALCGSLRKGSYTASALKLALEGSKRFGATTSFLDLKNYDLPFHPGLPEAGRDNEAVRRLRADVKAADGLILGTPEYHGSYSGVLKNALDFLTFEEMEGKMMGLVGVSGGAMGAFDAMNGLRSVGRALHAWVIPSQTAIPQAWNVFDEAGKIRDVALAKRVGDVGYEVARFAHLHKCGRLREFLHDWEKAQENPGGEG